MAACGRASPRSALAAARTPRRSLLLAERSAAPPSRLPAPVIRGAGPGAALPAPPRHPGGERRPSRPPAPHAQGRGPGPRTLTGVRRPGGKGSLPPTGSELRAHTGVCHRSAKSPPCSCQGARISWPSPGDSASPRSDVVYPIGWGSLHKTQTVSVGAVRALSTPKLKAAAFSPVTSAGQPGGPRGPAPPTPGISLSRRWACLDIICSSAEPAHLPCLQDLSPPAFSPPKTGFFLRPICTELV